MTRNRPTKDRVKPADAGDAAAMDEVRTALFDMESELRQIECVLKLLSILGEAGDRLRTDHHCPSIVKAASVSPKMALGDFGPGSPEGAF